MEPRTENPPVFTETQWAGRRWWWLALLVFGLVWLVSQSGVTESSVTSQLLPVGVAALAAGALLLMRLETRVDAFGIHYRYIPTLNRWRHWPWAEFRQVMPRTYEPLGEVGGWGIKGWPGNLVYNVWGPYGLQLTFQSGDRLLLGTQRPAELARTLEALGKLPVSTVTR